MSNDITERNKTGASARFPGRTLMAHFQKSKAALASQNGLTFEREDWSLFRTIEGLQQRAGVPKSRLRRLVLKELADNGLDTRAEIKLGELPKGGYFIEDNGRGIDGTPEDIAKLFSIRRAMVSSKLLRLPTRGALGNGLRVVASAVLVSGGSLVVSTRNRRITLRPERDGTTTVVKVEAIKFPVGTRIEIRFGPALPGDANALAWAEAARKLAGKGQTYLGKSSPHWYDPAQFHELLDASGARPVRELIAQLDGCTGAKAGEIVAKAGLGRALCNKVTQQAATKLLETARANTKTVNPERLGGIGSDVFPDSAYACAHGIAYFGSVAPKAEIPYVVEAWAARSAGTILSVYVNRTPVTGNIEAAREKRDIDAYGCGLTDTIAQAPKDAEFDIQLNVITPFMPITSDGKEPDLTPFLDEICSSVRKAVRKAYRPSASARITQKDVVLDNLEAAIADVSGDDEFRFNQRQLLYALRPIVLRELREELKTANFTSIITGFEAEHGEIRGMYREPRGTIYHPHRKETITLGTLMVEEYERPAWTFNKLVYIEKEGFSEALKDVSWGERHDCT
jgi:hypothetical protein